MPPTVVLARSCDDSGEKRTEYCSFRDGGGYECCGLHSDCSPRGRFRGKRAGKEEKVLVNGQLSNVHCACRQCRCSEVEFDPWHSSKFSEEILGISEPVLRYQSRAAVPGVINITAVCGMVSTVFARAARAALLLRLPCAPRCSEEHWLNSKLQSADPWQELTSLDAIGTKAATSCQRPGRQHSSRRAISWFQNTGANYLPVREIKGEPILVQRGSQN